MSHIVDRTRQQLDAFSPRRRISMILLVLAAFTMVGTAAWAYWTTTDAGTASASTGTINPPTNSAATSTPGSGVVAVSWTNSTPAAGISPSGYYVTRVRNSDSARFNACGSTPTSATASTPCNDNGVADGTYHYVVTAVKASWTAASASSNSVTVVNDNTAPTVPAPVATAAVSFGTNPMFVTHEAVLLTDAASDAGSGVASVSYYYCVGSAGSCTSGTGTFIGTSTTAAGNYPVTTNAFVTVSDGPYRIVAVGVDNASNTSAVSAATLVTVDTTAPTVSRPTVNGHP